MSNSARLFRHSNKKITEVRKVLKKQKQNFQKLQINNHTNFLQFELGNALKNPANRDFLQNLNGLFTLSKTCAIVALNLLAILVIASIGLLVGLGVTQLSKKPRCKKK